MITFTVGRIQADQKVLWEQGAITEFNLTRSNVVSEFVPTPTTRSATFPPPTTGPQLTFRYVCWMRTLPPCQLVQGFFYAVNRRTNGHIDFESQDYSEVGLSGSDMIRLLEDGTVAIGEIHGAFAGQNFPIFEATSHWGAYETSDQGLEAIEALREDIISFVRKATAGGEVVGFNYYPENYYFTKTPLGSIEDFQEEIIVSQSPVVFDLNSALGADPTYIAISDVYPTLERGVIDGTFTCGTCALDQKLFEVTAYMTGPLPGTFVESYIAFNSTKWNSLPSDFQDIIKEEGALHSQRSMVAALQANADAEQELIDLGMTHSNFSPEMLPVFREAVSSSVIPKWVERAGGSESETVRLYNEKVAPITGLPIVIPTPLPPPTPTPTLTPVVGERGNPGATGLTGPTGPTGPAGPAGDDGASLIAVVALVLGVLASLGTFGGMLWRRLVG